MRNSRWTALLAGAGFILTSCGGVNFSLVPPVRPLVENTVSGTGENKILLLDISGILMDSPAKSPLRLSQPIGLVERVKEELLKAESDDSVRAVVLRINSPGGTVTTSDVLYHEILEFKKRKKVPVVASMMDVAASGGYYVAASADRIVAHPTTITGSIGVIVVKVNLEGLMEKVGVEAETVKSGENKDLGSPFRKLTDEERVLVQGIIDDFYGRFLDVVRTGRGEKPVDEGILDGRILTADQALQGNLIDRVGYLEEAIGLAREEAGLDSARVVVYRRPGHYVSNVYSSAAPDPSEPTVLPHRLSFLEDPLQPQFMYLWLP